MCSRASKVGPPAGYPCRRCRRATHGEFSRRLRLRKLRKSHWRIHQCMRPKGLEREAPPAHHCAVTQRAPGPVSEIQRSSGLKPGPLTHDASDAIEKCGPTDRLVSSKSAPPPMQDACTAKCNLLMVVKPLNMKRKLARPPSRARPLGKTVLHQWLFCRVRPPPAQAAPSSAQDPDSA